MNADAWPWGGRCYRTLDSCCSTPLGSLDVARRQDILPYLDRLIAELRLPMIYVTHDAAEVHGRATQAVVMESGIATVDEGQHGTPA